MLFDIGKFTVMFFQRFVSRCNGVVQPFKNLTINDLSICPDSHSITVAMDSNILELGACMTVFFLLVHPVLRHRAVSQILLSIVQCVVIDVIAHHIVIRLHDEARHLNHCSIRSTSDANSVKRARPLFPSRTPLISIYAPEVFHVHQGELTLRKRNTLERFGFGYLHGIPQLFRPRRSFVGA